MINGKYYKKYALYKGDKYLYSGSLLQLSIKRNVKLKTIQFYLTPSYKKRLQNSKNRIELVEI